MSLTIHTARPVESTGRHRAVPHRCRALPAVLLARMLHGRGWFTALTIASAVALFFAMVEEFLEFANTGEVPHLAMTALLLVALYQYGSRCGTGESQTGIGFWDVVFFASVGASVIQESVDLDLDHEWTHGAVLLVLAASTCIYAIRCWTQD